MTSSQLVAVNISRKMCFKKASFAIVILKEGWSGGHPLFGMVGLLEVGAPNHVTSRLPEIR